MVKVVRKSKKPAKVKAEPAGPVNEIPGLPRAEGPPSIPNYGARDLYAKDTGVHMIEIDEGALRWLWEVVEANGLNHYRKYHKVSPQLTGAAIRALTAVRQTGHSAFPPKDESPRPKRSIKRKKTKSSPARKS